MLGIRVVNGGVCAYGVDQAAMRAKILIRQYSPRAVILGLISDDIRRTGLYMIGGLLRPYFSIEGNELKLHPIPEGKALENVERVARARSNDIFRKVFGYSSLFHVLMMRIDPEYWMVGVNEKETSQDPERIAFEVMKDLDVYLTRLGIPGFVLAQDSGIAGPSALDDRGRMIRFLKCISKTHFNLIDVYPVTYDILRKDRAEYGSLFRGHMTAKGNWLMAEILAPAIKSYFRLRDSKK